MKEQEMTFSILGFDIERNEFGIATCSAIPCIGEYFAFGDGSCGVIAAQGSCNPYNGLKAINLLKSNIHPEEIISLLKKEDANIGRRQIAIIDKNGNKSCFTGAELGTGTSNHIIGNNSIVCGNTLEKISLLDEMHTKFESNANRPLYLRLLDSLKIGNKSSDVRGKQSAALHVYSIKNDYAVIKINIDDDENPIDTLENKTKKFIDSFYRIIPYFPQRDGSQKTPEKGSEAELVFKEFRKHVSERNFNF